MEDYIPDIDPEPHLVTIFAALFKFDENFILLILILTKELQETFAHALAAQQLGIIKILFQYADQEYNCSKANFPLNLNCDAKLLSGIGPSLELLASWYN